MAQHPRLETCHYASGCGSCLKVGAQSLDSSKLAFRAPGRNHEVGPRSHSIRWEEDYD